MTGFNERELEVLKILYRSSNPLTVYEILNRSKVKMAWETCQGILEALHEEEFVEKEELRQTKVLWSINYETKEQLKKKYKLSSR